MAGETLADFADITVGQSPPGDAVSTARRGLPLLNGPTEFGPHHPTPVQFTTEAHKLARPGDILFCVRGSTTGRMNWADQEYAIGRGVAAVRHRETPELQPFVRAVIEFQLSDLLAQATGSTFPNVSASQLAALTYPRLEKNEQRAIAHILGTLDDKIELNRKMNETLEAIARAIFKSWFVDFDPVRAKTEGRPTGLPKHISDLFPDAFEDSQLGEIPKGWKAGSLDRFFSVGLGGTWGKDQPSERASVSVRCLRGIDCHQLAEGVIPDVPVRWLSADQVADRRLVDGTILVEGSGSFCGRSLLWSSSYGRLFEQPVSYSNFCKRLDPLCSASQAAVCWLQIRKTYREGELQAFRTGTAFPNFDIHGALASLIVVVPAEPVADAFMQFLNLDRRVDLMAESRTLAAVRDALLPKLISGEIRIKDAGKFMEAAQ